jgi:hypothetical protein
MAIVRKNLSNANQDFPISDGSEDFDTPSPNGPKATKTPLAPKGNSVVSDYLGYGSYNGADCKVIVHLPRDVSKARYLQSEIEETSKSLNTYMSIEAPADPQGAQVRYETIRGLEEYLAKTEQTLKDVNAIPTTKVLGEIQTFSWSIFREKSPVRTLGSVYPKTYVRGPRTIGGSMVFTVFNQHVLHELLDLDTRYYSTGTGDFDRFQYSTNLPDQLPPIDVTLMLANEYGSVSYMGIYGLEFVQEGGTFSIEDIFSESVVQYVARDIDPLRNVLLANRNSQGIVNTYKTASRLSSEKDVTKRRNMFI